MKPGDRRLRTVLARMDSSESETPQGGPLVVWIAGAVFASGAVATSYFAVTDYHRVNILKMDGRPVQGTIDR